MAQFNNTVINSATPAQAIMDWLGPILVEQGWEFVETLYAPMNAGAITGSITGTAASATATRLTRSGGSSWNSSALVGYSVQITGGTGASSTPVLITANAMTTLDVAAWPAGTPDATSTFAICGLSSIYKSPAASNSVGQDFYIALHRPQAATEYLRVLLFEEWDSVTKKARKYAPYQGSGITVNPVDNTVTDAVGLYPTLGAISGMTMQWSVGFFSPANTARTLHVDVTVNRIVWGLVGTGAVADSGYVGVFQSLLPASLDPVPLVIWKPDKGSGATLTAYSATTREPTAPAAAQMNFQVCSWGSSGSSREFAFIPLVGTVTLPLVDQYLGAVAARIMFNTSRSGTTPRGVLDGPITAHSGGAAGDTLTVTMPDTSVRHYVLTTVTGTYSAHFFVRTS